MMEHKQHAGNPTLSHVLADDVPGFKDLDERAPRGASAVIVLAALFFVVMAGWAAVAEIDEVTRAEGRVIPFSKTQLIQSAEPGVVQEILVRPGQHVRQGDILVRLDPTTSAATLGESEARAQAVEAKVARLKTEYEGNLLGEYVCPTRIKNVAPEVCDNEANLLAARRESYLKNTSVLEERVEQREHELAGAEADLQRLKESLEIAERELALLAPLSQRNLVSKTDLLRVERDVSDIKGQIATGEQSIARIQAALRESKLQLQQALLQFRQEALSELTAALSELSIVRQTISGAETRMFRTDIRSPVDGIVNSLEVNTVGAFVSSGTQVMDIVPIADKLLVEGRVRPQDIAFIRPGQEATVKITAYDFSIYGGLDGIVDTVSADSVYDQETRETFYIVLVRTEEAELTKDEQTLPVMPGMVAEVDILTGKKTILQYILKPFNQARHEALTER